MRIVTTLGNIVTTKREDHLLCKAIDIEYNKDELGQIIGCIYLNKDYASSYIAEELFGLGFVHMETELVEIAEKWLEGVERTKHLRLAAYSTQKQDRVNCFGENKFLDRHEKKYDTGFRV